MSLNSFISQLFLALTKYLKWHIQKKSSFLLTVSGLGPQLLGTGTLDLWQHGSMDHGGRSRPVHFTMENLGERSNISFRMGSQHILQRHSLNSITVPTRHHNLNSCHFPIILQTKNPDSNTWPLKNIRIQNTTQRFYLVWFSCWWIYEKVCGLDGWICGWEGG